MGKPKAYRRKNLRRIIPDRVLPAPLLQQKNDEGDDEPHEISFPEEGLFQTEPLTRLSLLLDRRLDFGQLASHVGRVDALVAEVGEVGERVL